MQIQLIRNDLSPNQKHWEFDAERMTRSDGGAVWYWKSGTILDVPERAAWLFMKNGDAVPADTDAEKVMESIPGTHEGRVMARELLAKGIAKDDEERFINGEIFGYDEDGNDIPGPNWVDEDEDDDNDD